METKEQFFSNSGIPIKGIYTPEDVKDIDHDKDIGVAGQAPFTRGVYPNMYRGRFWTIRRYSGYSTPEDANKLFREEYKIGQTGFSLALDALTQAGIDSDDPGYEDDIGDCGVPVDSLNDIETIFDGLPVDKVSTYIGTGGAPGCAVMAMYFVMAEKRGFDINQLMGTNTNCMISGNTLWLTQQIPPAASLRYMVDFPEWCCQYAPRWHPVSVNSYNARENGVNAVQELGFIMSNAIEFIEEEKRRGRVPLDQFIRRFSFNTGLHNDFFEEIAKLRAGRRMWHKLARERFGIENPKCWQWRVHIQSSGCTHTTQEPLNNIIRISYQMLAAALGGAQSTHANGYDEGVCIPTEQGMLLSIRTGQILQYETNVINTVDPLGGSWYIESLTNEVEQRAWEYVQKIEDMGGFCQAVNSGWFHRELRDAMIEHESKVASGETTIVGVNKFRLEKEPYEVPIFEGNPKRAEIQSSKVRQLKKERDNTKVAQALQKLEEVTRSGENVMPATMEAVKAYATVGEVTDVARKVYGTWPYPMGI